MTREEADAFQELLDSYSEAKRRGKAPITLSMMRSLIAPKIEPLLPYERGAGPGGVMDLLGPVLKMLAPKAFERDLRVAVVDGHEKENRIADDFDLDDFYEKYGVSIPGDLVEEAMQLRSHARLYEIGAKMLDEEDK